MRSMRGVARMARSRTTLGSGFYWRSMLVREEICMNYQDSGVLEAALPKGGTT